MTTVTIAPPVVNVCDILEYARELLVVHPWRQGQRVPDSEDWDAVSANGLSLHDAIGMACFRLSGEVGKTASPARASSHSKDFPAGAKAADYGYTGTLRNATVDVLSKHLPQGVTDVVFNDRAKNVGEVIAVLDKAIQEVCNGVVGHS